MSTICYEINKESKAMLLKKFPPKYPEVKYDHLTISIGGINETVPEPAKKVEIIGIADDGYGLEAFIAKVDDSLIRPDDGLFWHMTASFDPEKTAPASFDVFAAPEERQEKKYRAVTSNGFLAQALDKNGQPKEDNNPQWKIKIFDKPIKIYTHPQVQYKPHELKMMKENNYSL